MFNWTKKLFGDPNEKELKTIEPLVEKINSYELRTNYLNFK